MSKRLLRAPARLILIGLLVLAPLAGRCELSRVTIGANPTGTNFNIIGGGFAKVIQENLGMPSIVRPYAGSSVYLPLLHRGEITLGINSSIDSHLAYHGERPYSAALTNIRALIAVYPLGYMYWVRATSEMRQIEDLVGKRVVLNYRGLVVLDRLNRAILASGGLTEEDVQPLTAAGLAEGARMVLEGRADAVATGHTLPLVRQTHVGLPGGLKFLRMGEDLEQVSVLMPGAWVTTVVPSASTVGIDEPTRMAVYQTYLNGGTHLSAQDAYQIVKVLHENWSQLRRDYGVLESIAPQDIAPADNPHPYHVGAVAYFKEAGLWTDSHQKNQRRFDP